jgi:hypothetical protein
VVRAVSKESRSLVLPGTSCLYKWANYGRTAKLENLFIADISTALKNNVKREGDYERCVGKDAKENIGELF